VEGNPFVPYEKVAEEVFAGVPKEDRPSARSINRVANKEGIRDHVAREKGNLTDEERAERQQYCVDMVTKPESYYLGEGIHFYIDAKRFRKDFDPKRAEATRQGRCHRRKGDGLKNKCVRPGRKETKYIAWSVENQRKHGVNIMTGYGGPAGGVRCTFAEVYDRMTGATFAGMVRSLGAAVRACYPGKPTPAAGWVVSMDGDTCLRTAAVRQAMRRARCTYHDGPAKSGDLRPVENWWREVDTVLRKQNAPPGTEESYADFSARCVAALKGTGSEKLENLVRSHVRRFRKCIKNDGGRVNY
jgi:hypothetical protein